MTSFPDLRLIKPLLRALDSEGYSIPTPVQRQAIPPALEGRDVLGIAQTGTGKTAAFTLPVLQRLSYDDRRPTPRSPRALILTPTRELAIQIGESIGTYGRHLPHRHTVIFGGVGQQPQVFQLRRGVDTLVATPGRLLDLMNQGHVRLNRIEVFILDEADRMLDMGFIHDVRKVVAELPEKRQTLLFSATMPKTIATLATQVLTNYALVEVQPSATTAEKVDQKVLFADKGDKRGLLEHLFQDPTIARAIVFTRTKYGADRVARFLKKAGVECDAIHGNKSQGARQRALNAFRDGSLRALIATDIASRGIDVDDVTHVINFELPHEPESYVHRIGRTARAGAEGIALSFCDTDEVTRLRAIEKITGQTVTVVEDHPFHKADIADMYARSTRRGRENRERSAHLDGSYGRSADPRTGDRRRGQGESADSRDRRSGYRRAGNNGQRPSGGNERRRSETGGSRRPTGGGQRRSDAGGSRDTGSGGQRRSDAGGRSRSGGDARGRSGRGGRSKPAR